MGLTAPAKSKKPTAPTIKLRDLLSQLDGEWQARDKAEPTGLAAYFHVAARIGVEWVRGDPYTFAFPASYQGERLARLCVWLRGLTPEQLPAARESQLAALRQTWLAYEQRCTAPMPNGSSPHNQEFRALPYTWDGLDSLWQTEESALEEQTSYLPQFHCRAAEDFHLVTLAVLYLNRALRRRLADLEPQPTATGRN